MNHSVRGSAMAVLALSALLVVSGCNSGGSGSGDGVTAAAGTPSVTAAPSATATVAAPSAGATPSATATPVATTAVTASAAPKASAGCRNLSATAAAKAAVISAYQAKFPFLTRIETAPSSFFYGVCGQTEYALTQFRSTSGASEQQLVAMQDDGSARKFFEDDNGSGWRYVSSDTFPATPGCVGTIPSSLVAAWGHCSLSN